MGYVDNILTNLNEWENWEQERNNPGRNMRASAGRAAESDWGVPGSEPQIELDEPTTWFDWKYPSLYINPDMKQKASKSVMRDLSLVKSTEDFNRPFQLALKIRQNPSDSSGSLRLLLSTVPTLNSMYDEFRKNNRLKENKLAFVQIVLSILDNVWKSAKHP